MTNEPYKVSVLVPVYGVEKYIERCAVSLMEQTYQNIEYIFIDDCGPDKSISILKDVIERYPNRKTHVHIIRHEHNRGLAAARNTAVSISTGEFLLHVDSDDYISSEAVEKLVEVQNVAGADIVNADYSQVFKDYNNLVKCEDAENGRDMCLKIISSKAGGNIWNRLIKTDIYKKHNITAVEGHNMGEDYQVSPLLYYYAEKVSSVHGPLYYYSRENEDSYMNAEFSEAKAEAALFSFRYIVDKFSSKEDIFKNASKIGLLRCLVGCLDDIGKSGGHNDYYKKLRAEILSMSKYIGSLSYRHQMAIKLSACKPIFTFYIRFGAWIKVLLNENNKGGEEKFGD